MQHIIYIFDHPSHNDNNIKFLSYIKRHHNIIKNMDVRIKIITLLPSDLDNPSIQAFIRSRNIDEFPSLITDTKVYKGLKEIINIYETNISEYNKYYIQLEKQKQLLLTNNIPKPKPKPIPIPFESELNDDDELHSYMQNNLQLKNKYDDDEEDTIVGDSGDNTMMDTYRHHMSKRNVNRKNPFNSKMRTIESDTNKKIDADTDVDIQAAMFQQMQKNKLTLNTNHNELTKAIDKYNNNVDDDDEREDNINNTNDYEESSINVDPTKINYDDDDPQDSLLEKAYWSRISETK